MRKPRFRSEGLPCDDPVDWLCLGLASFTCIAMALMNLAAHRTGTG